MRTLLRGSLKKLVAAGILCLLTVLAGCTVPAGEGFAIYLTRDNIPAVEMPALSHIELAAVPIVSTDDIISYDVETHEVKLAQEAYQRVSGLEVPVQGRAFVVCLNRSPVYSGAFWTPVSSMSFNGIVIMKPLGLDATSITIGMGYPSSQFFQGEDPRSDPALMDAIRQAKKLK